MSALSWLEPRGLWALALLPCLLWLSLRSRAELTRVRRFGSLTLRSLAVVTVALALARPVLRSESHDSATVVLVDVSDSMDDASLQAARDYVAQLRSQPTRTSTLELVTFAGAPQRIALTGSETAPLARHADGRSSDLERAVSLGLGLLPEDRIGQLVLFSDGRETHGQLQRAIVALRERQVSLWIGSGSKSVTPELGVLDLRLPDTIRVGEPFAVQARLVSSVPMSARARLLQNGAPNPLESARVLTSSGGETTVSFRSSVRSAGKVEYRLELSPVGPDRFPDNNQFERSAMVRGAPRVLYVEREGAQAYALLDLLRAASFEVELRAPEGAPSSSAELASFDFYVLSDVPAEALSRDALLALTRFVTEGGGLLIAGGERAFGLGGYRGTPLEALSAVGLGTTARREQASLALMLAIDKSGSMAGEKLERAKEAAIATAELLPSDSYLGVIGFDAQPEQVVRLSLASSVELVARKVATLAAGGGTAIFPALDAAYAALAGVRARVKHVVVLTDGQTQEESLIEVARSMRADGITISTIGLGEEVNRGLLSELARLGAGRAYYTRDPSKVPRLFTEETRLVARSLAVERHVRARRVADAAFLQGVALAQAPPLRGYVSTSQRAAPAELILTTEDGEPLLARMRLGSGWALAWTSDLKPRWSSDWFHYRDFSRLLAQLIREHMRHDERSPLPIETRLVGDTLYASVELLDESARFVNGLTGSVELTDDRGLTRTTELFQRAPGRYEAELALTELGTYGLRARLASLATPSAPTFVAAGSVSLPFPAEYRPPFGADEASLQALAKRTGGGPLPPARELSRARGRTAARPSERWPALVWLALGLFLLDVAVRRMAVPGGLKRQGT